LDIYTHLDAVCPSWLLYGNKSGRKGFWSGIEEGLDEAWKMEKRAKML
jgi:hypothetical protein